jgi:hypothetical protein
MKNSSTVVLSLLMIGFSLVAMPASYASDDHEKSYGYSEKYDQEKSYGYSKNYDQFLDIKNADIGIKGDVIKKIFIETRDEIPTDGSAGAFGYGVVLSDGKAIVTTTHAGVLDSELQLNIRDPVWHNHFVQLANNTACVSDTAVGDLSFESPGEVIVQDNIALLKKLPASAIGQFTNSTITPGSDIQIVASFKLQPLLDLTLLPEGNPLVAVCVEDIQSVDPKYVNIFEVDEFNYGNHYDQEAPRY